MTKQHTCYLSGPITGLSFKGATDWRTYAQRHLNSHIAGLDPMRGKGYLSGTGSLNMHYEQHTMSTANGIFGRDLWDTLRCDVMLVNVLSAETISIGTAVEIGWFTTRPNPLIICGEPDNPFIKHPLTANRATYITNTLDEAIECINALFSNELGW